MITDSELRISNESYTRKDFYQIYPEILELVGKITERWKPDESNESDPGVVLLKLLAFIADKTNYNIDKNILECFMPSATQNDSMRKLCEMMGYEMHYYRSAETEVSFMWTGKELKSTNQESEGSIILPAFETVITDDSKEVSYVLIDSIQLTHRNSVQSGTAIEGAYCTFEINNDNIVRYYNLDDNLRLYLPESHVAENGIWIYNEEDKDAKRYPWTKVSNLNTQLPDTKVWKFGYDSKKKLPYIQFPQDVVELMNNGLSIFYIRTSGESGNVNAKALTTLANTTTLKLYKLSGEIEDVEISKDNNNYLTIQNSSGSVNGSDVESIDDAYNGFKKTVGTFDTLVTCRDYANAIYNLLDPKYNPYVSNVLVSDIRDNLNFSENVITLDQYGCHNIISPKMDGGKPVMDHFDLYILPFKPITTSYNSKTFQNSFKPTSENYYDIINELENYKTISHNYKTLDSITNKDDIYCFKNKYRLKASISTTYKVNSAEEKEILNNIYRELYKNFNARKVDFGEEIPYDSVLKVIENADTRIKVVILEDFEITPWVMFANGNEYELYVPDSEEDKTNPGCKMYKQMVAKNVLAGKLPLFNYDKSVKYKFGEKGDEEYPNIIGETQNYPSREPITISTDNSITYITTKLEIKNQAFNAAGGYELRPNQSIQFLAPAYTSIVTYPAYTNYFANISLGGGQGGTPCDLYHITFEGRDLTQDEFNAIIEALKTSTRVTNKTMYIQASLPDFGKTPGYLVDSKYYKYSPTTRYITGGKFYCQYKVIKNDNGYSFEEGSYTLGTDPKYPYISKNTEYQLKSGEYLAIHFKDSAETLHDIIYCKEGNNYLKKEWINKIAKEDEKFSGYIKFNFDLYDSETWKSMGHEYVKKDGYYFDGYNIPGLFSLGASEEIEPRQLSQVTFDGTESSYLKCYWYTNEPTNKLTFNRITDNTFERILDADEYFFYTNDMETVLVTYGSGTILRLEGSQWGTDSSNEVEWNLPEDEEDSLNLDDISSKGIGAFSDVNWQLKTVNISKKLIIQESSIINLGEGDSIYCSSDLVDSGSGKTDNSWKELASDAIENLTYNEVNKLTGGLNWKVRSILNLNIGPSCIQTLKSDENVEEKILTYTSAWYYMNSQGKKYVNPVHNDEDKAWDELTEEIQSDHTASFENTSLKSNYLVQRAGGEKLSMHRYRTDKTEVDDLLIIPFISEPCEYAYNTSNEETKVVEINDDYTKLNLINLNYLSLPINIKENKFGVMSFYYTPDEGDADVHICIYPGGEHESGEISTGAMISEYKDMAWIGTNNQPDDKYVYVLHKGLNCLRIDHASYVIIHPMEGEHKGTLIFTQMDVVNTKDGENIIESGLDYKLLGLNKDVSDTPSENDDCNKFLKDYIVNYENFFYNAPISNENRIDVDTMNPAENNYMGWNNVNNICNKFTIAELDVDSFSDIKIARPSKLY